MLPRLLPNVRRLAAWAVVAAAVVTIVPVVLAAAGAGFGLTGDLATRLTTVATVASFVLVLLTLGVAFAAYLAATGVPSLSPVVSLPFSVTNSPTLEWEKPDVTGLQAAVSYKQLELSVEVTNTSQYAARNPGIRLDLINCAMLVDSEYHPEVWTPRRFVNTFGTTSLQWDGGADQVIHGNWTRSLPPFYLNGLRRLSGQQAALRLTLVADGWGPQVHDFPIGDRSSNSE